jgi:hypothetical protein
MTATPVTSMTSTTIALHPAPRWAAVAREQLRSVGLVLRREGMIFAALTALVAWGSISGIPAMLRRADGAGAQGGHVTTTVFDSDLAILVAIVAFLLPLAVWRGEPAARRPYHAAMPVGERAHTLTRVAAGWCWAMLGVLAFELVLLAMAAVAERMVQGSSITIRYPHAPGDLWQWLVPFTAATLAYVVGSAWVLASRYPWRWILGPVAGYAIAFASLDHLAPRAGGWRAYDLWNGNLGVVATLTGQMRVPRVYTVVNGEQWVFTQWRPDASTWLVGTAVWGVVAGALLWYAIARRRDVA